MVRDLEIMPQAETVGEREAHRVLSTEKIGRVVLCKKFIQHSFRELRLVSKSYKGVSTSSFLINNTFPLYKQ